MKIRKRTIAGGVLAVGILIGSYLSGWNIPGFGDGSSDNGDGADAPDQSTMATLQGDVDILPRVEATRVPDDVLDVQIQDRSYAVRQQSEGEHVYQPADLDQIIEWAKLTTGDDQGIRVRIHRRPSARVSAWETLQHALIKAGLSQNSVQLQEGLVE